jgi:hypothetical protein
MVTNHPSSLPLLLAIFSSASHFNLTRIP